MPLFWVIQSAVVAFFLPLWPGGVAFLAVTVIFTAVFGWAQGVRQLAWDGRASARGGHVASLLMIGGVNLALCAVGYSLGRGAALLLI